MQLKVSWVFIDSLSHFFPLIGLKNFIYILVNSKSLGWFFVNKFCLDSFIRLRNTHGDFFRITMMTILKSTSILKMIKSFICIMMLAASNVHCNVTSPCGQRELFNSYLDIAIDMITKAKQHIPICNKCPTIENKPVDCADVLEMGNTTSGIYEIWPMNRITEGKSLNVYCDMDTDGGGWTVFQRRGDSRTPKEYFYRDWASYKEGFGHMDKDFWLGNDNIFVLTNQKLYSARFDMKDTKKNRRFVLYDTFWIDDENHKYTLHVSEYTGDAGGEYEAQENISEISGDCEDKDSISDTFGFNDYADYFQDQKIPEKKNSLSKSDWSQSVSSDQTHHSTGDSLKLHNNQPFSTFDRDNDNQRFENCAKKYKGAWWYNNCPQANLNDMFHKERQLESSLTLKGLDQSLEWTEIKIRPKYFKFAPS